MLNERQKRFALEYLIDLNATQAAMRAGYSKKTAHSQGPRLLDNVEIATLVGKRQQRAISHLDVTAERIILERARLAFHDPRKAFHGDGTPKAIHELDDDTAACVAGFEVANVGNDQMGIGQILKVKLADKNASLTALEKIQGMYSTGDEPAGVLNIHVHIGS